MAACSAASNAEVEKARTKTPTLLDFFREHGPAFEASHPVGWEQRRFLRALLVCRTAALGGHLYACDQCGCEVPMYNSCRNRHCPACQALDQARWIRKREERLLPIGHHHVVFTLPAELRALGKRHPREIYGLLFKAASSVLAEFARIRWRARLGVTAVLHTWTRELAFHPHLHCIVTAGGLSLEGDEWIDQRQFLFPVNQLKCAFAAQVLEHLQRLRGEGALSLPEDGAAPDALAWQRLVNTLPSWRRWVVHIQPPFGRSTHVLKYLGRYTHRVAISDTRVVAIAGDRITFRTRGDDQITLTADEFIGRFLQHILPRGFHKIRHFGLYAPSAGRPHERAALLLGEGDAQPHGDPTSETDDAWADLLKLLTGDDPHRCPHCREGRLVPIAELPRIPRPPP